MEEEILYEIGKGVYLAKEGINQVLFVFKEKFTPEQIRTFNLFRELISESGITKFTTLVRTNFINFRNSQKCEEDRQKLLNENNDISEIIKSCNCNSSIVHVDNPSVEEDSDNEEEVVINKKDRKD